MTAEMFDQHAFALRQERARRAGPVLFVYDRIVDDILERLGEVRRSFDRAMLIGAASPTTAGRLQAHAASVHEIEGSAGVPDGGFDLVVCLARLDVIDDLPGRLRLLRSHMRADGLLMGAFPGGNTLPQLRAAMRAGDLVEGTAAPHAHPRVEAAALGHLLSGAGFVMPVVDVDRVRVAYPSFGRLIADLRAMAATNVLSARPRRLGRAALLAAQSHFESTGAEGRTVETFELLHFAAWTPRKAETTLTPSPPRIVNSIRLFRHRGRGPEEGGLAAIRRMMLRLFADKAGATAIEYGLIAALIVIAMVGALSALGGGAGGMWTNISSDVTTATAPQG